MSKKVFRIFFLLIIAGTIIFIYSCNKDNTAPEITIIGNNPVYSCFGLDYQDMGATAIDNEDGDITHKINTTSNVDIEAIGLYEVKYSVKDNAGNIATATRTVEVIYCK